MRTRICALLFVLVVAACIAPEPTSTEAAIVDEVASIASSLGSFDTHEDSRERRDFHREMIGVWRTKIFERGAWVDLVWVVGVRRAWHVVTAYADEAMTMPLLRWSIVRSHELGRPSQDFPMARELAWRDLTASLTAYVEDEALFSALGVDDCNLSPNEPVELAPTNCGAPIFPFRDCAMMDFVELSDGRLTFGDPEQGDRCLVRPTRRERWGFYRVPLTQDLLRTLLSP